MLYAESSRESSIMRQEYHESFADNTMNTCMFTSKRVLCLLCLCTTTFYIDADFIDFFTTNSELFNFSSSVLY